MNKVANYRCYSRTNRDAQEVRQQNRFRGCRVGNPVIVWGDTIRESEMNLIDLRNSLECSGAIILDFKRGSMVVEEVEIDE